MSLQLFILIASFGFLGSFHCIAMCGGLSAQVSAGDKGFSLLRFSLYVLGRVLSYSLLGLLVGLFSAVFFKSFLKNYGVYLFVLMGLSFVFYGVSQLSVFIFVPWCSRTKFFVLPDKVKSTFFSLPQLLPFPTPFSLGLVTGLLPCAFLYSALLQAVAVAHPLWSALSMAIFAVSTGPALAVSGFFVFFLGRSKIRVFSSIGSLLVFGTGCYILLRAFFGVKLGFDCFW